MSTLDNKYFSVNGLQRASWYMTYSPLDVDAEIRKMVAWLDANPKRRKKNYARFITGWLNKAHSQLAQAQVEARHFAATRQTIFTDKNGKYRVTAEGSREYIFNYS